MVIDLPWSTLGKYGGIMRMGTTSTTMSDITQHMYGFSSLHWSEGGLEVGPGLAKSFEFNEDKSVWTLYYRRGIHWSDGEPFTVDDVLYWWEDQALNEECATVPGEGSLVGGKRMEITKLDDYTIQLKFANTAPVTDAFIAAWSNGGMTGTSLLDCQPKHYMEQFHPDYSDNKDFETYYEHWNYWEEMDHPVLTAWDPVKLEVGQRMVLDRNAYYYMVDKEGNQLPYINRCDLRRVEDLEVLNLQIIGGQVDFLAHPILQLRDLPLLKDSEDSGGYKVELWDNDAGGAPAWGINWNHPEDDKREMIRKVEFRRALSHAINRQQNKDMVFFGLGGPLSTGLASYNARQYDRTPEGKEIREKLLNFAVEYDPGKAEDLLDEAGLVDVNGDGWRDLPGGAEFKFYVQINSGSAYMESADMMKDDWRAVGINAIVEAMPGSQLGVIHREATFDCRIFAGGAPGQAELLSNPVFIISYNTGGRWAPLYGSWMALEGTAREGVDADKPPRERQPPWEEPPPDDPTRRMWEIYKKAMVEPDDRKRDLLVHEIFQIHLDEGPFWLGIVADLPRPVIISKKLKNVPGRDEIPFGGWLGPWGVGQPGAITYPEQYFFDV